MAERGFETDWLHCNQESSFEASMFTILKKKRVTFQLWQTYIYIYVYIPPKYLKASNSAAKKSQPLRKPADPGRLAATARQPWRGSRHSPSVSLDACLGHAPLSQKILEDVKTLQGLI